MVTKHKAFLVVAPLHRSSLPKALSLETKSTGQGKVDFRLRLKEGCLVAARHVNFGIYRMERWLLAWVALKGGVVVTLKSMVGWLRITSSIRGVSIWSSPGNTWQNPHMPQVGHCGKTP